jgi:hypothetical protein
LGVNVHGFRVQRFRVHRKAEQLIRSIIGWVKRDVGTIYVGFAYLDTPQKFEIATKLANPTRLVAGRRLNPTYNLSFRPTKWIPPLRKKKCKPGNLKFSLLDGGYMVNNRSQTLNL